MRKKYKKVAVGGTFDKFHQGHKQLIDIAFHLGEEIIIGVTSDEFGGRKGKIEPCEVRISHLHKFLQEKGRKYSIVRLDEPYGPTIHQRDIDAIIVSEETQATAQKINQIRETKNMKPLDIITISMVLAADGKPISSTRIRRGEIDQQGIIIKGDNK